MIWIQIISILIALVILYWGAELTLANAEKIGHSLGLSPLAIGILIVGFGTSLPEFFVSQIAAWEGKAGMAIGNLVGSNVANSFLILGIAISMVTIPMRGKNLWGQLIFHLILHLMAYLFLIPPVVSWPLQLGLIILFSSYIFYSAKSDMGVVEELAGEFVKTRTRDYGFFFMGMVLLFLGGELLTSQGAALAQSFGVSEYFISVIFISFGTSFPELVTAVVACAKKKDMSLVVGNILGSNFFNLSFVLGSLIFYEVEVSSSKNIELLSLCAISILLIGFKILKKIPRLIGPCFLITYGGIVYYWFLNKN